jgi:hypothetical protein
MDRTDSKINTPATHDSSPDVPGVVYFVRSGDSIKIGHATNFKDRLRTLQTGNENPLEVLAAVAGLNEYEIHQRFAHLRTRGEWFKAEPELLEFIVKLKMEAPEPKKGPRKDEPEHIRLLRTMMENYANAEPHLKPTNAYALRKVLKAVNAKFGFRASRQS